MVTYSTPEHRFLTVIAQDPTILSADGGVLMTKVPVPAERLAPGPRGHRVHVVDFDSSSNSYYAPRTDRLDEDPYQNVNNRDQLEADANFHAQNVYAIVSSTLLTFENALGRHVNWGFDYGTHQIKVAPHAFAELNAFYSRRDEGLLFGYFPEGEDGRKVFTCLSHDIVVHETTHALLDGLRRQYARPSSADQAAFHEGYADIIALLSVFQSKEMVAHGLATVPQSRDGTVGLKSVKDAIVNRSFLTGLARQMGQNFGGTGRDALRRSVALEPSSVYLARDAFREAHTRGEVIVAVVMQAYLTVWWDRVFGKLVDGIGKKRLPEKPLPDKRVELWRVADEGATAARHLLRVLIRALDYMPPVDIDFGDFLSAIITADSEACPDDSRYAYRETLRRSFAAYGIEPSSNGASIPGGWETPDSEFFYGHAHFGPMRWDREAIFRFIWENRELLKLVDEALTTVESVRPVSRIAPDGFVLNEVVVEYFQLLTLRADELPGIGLERPAAMPEWQNIRLYGGGTLVFDEFGRLKYDIANLLNSQRQNTRLAEMWERGAFRQSHQSERRFARLHRERALRQSTLAEEQW